MSTETMANTVAQGGYQRPQRAASAAAREAILRQAADTTDAASSESTGEEKAAADSENEEGDPFPSLRQLGRQQAADPNSRTARKANALVQSGLPRKAAQVLHSTTQMADMRTAEVQETMVRLHPRPSPGGVLPALPQMAPASVLEDDADMRQLITQSDNGTSAGPSGWGGNMLSLLV